MATKDKQRTRAVRLQQKQNRLAKQLQHNELKAQAEVKAEADAPELELTAEAKALGLELADEKCMDDMPMAYMAYGGATTFADAFAAMEAEEAAHEMHENTSMFQDIVRNILNNDTITDKAGAIASAADELKAIMAKPPEPDDAMKTVESETVEPDDHEAPDESETEPVPETDDEKSLFTQFTAWVKAKMSTASINNLPDSAFAYIEPGGKKDEGGKTTPRSLRHYPIHDAAHVRNALARASQAMNAGGKSAEIAKKAMGAIKAMAKKMKIGMAGEKKDSLPFFVYKDAEGQSHWFGVVSNKFRDRDTRNHPKGEIITEAAHKEFVEYLNANPTQAPQLWSWHTPGTARKSRADWWDYTDDGFLVMSGPLTDDEAKSFDEGESLGMSHGFYALERDTAQGLINKYRTFEVSELLPQFVANEWTDFAAIRKEIEMAFTPEKRGLLVKRFGEAKVSELEGKTGEMAKALETIGAEWKDVQPEAPKPEAPPAPPVEQKTTPEELDQHVLQLLNLAELRDGIKVISEQAALVPQLQAQLKDMETRLAALNKSDDEKIAEKLAPKVKPFDWGFRASSDPSTAVKENDPADQALKKTAPSDSWVKSISPIVA